MNDETHPFHDWDASYVLGMLSPEERRQFERHLSGCASCREAVAELAGMPGILATLSAAEASALQGDDADARSAADAHLRDVEHQPSQVRQLARAVSRGRTRARRRVAALVTGVGALVAVLGLIAGIGIAGTIAPGSATPDTGTARAMSQVEPGALDADLTVTAKGWGTRFDWNCSYRDDWADPDVPVTYDLVVTDAAGTETRVASWSATGSAAGNLSASTSIPTADIRSVDIRLAGSDRPLVRTAL